MTIKNKLLGTIALGICLIIVSSCNNVPNSPGWEYMPDMYRSSSYETNSYNPNFKDSMTDRLPVVGTISQGEIANTEFTIFNSPYPYKNDSLGFELAGQNLKDPYPASPEIVAQGKESFVIFCLPCHGEHGKGDGPVVTNGNFPPPPAYNGVLLKELPAGKIYHTIMYGKGMMGSYASQVTPQERWKIIRYVQTLQHPELALATPTAAKDSTNSITSTKVKETKNDTTAKSN